MKEFVRDFVADLCLLELWRGVGDAGVAQVRGVGLYAGDVAGDELGLFLQFYAQLGKVLDGGLERGWGKDLGWVALLEGLGDLCGLLVLVLFFVLGFTVTFY